MDAHQLNWIYVVRGSRIPRHAAMVDGQLDGAWKAAQTELLETMRSVYRAGGTPIVPPMTAEFLEEMVFGFERPDVCEMAMASNSALIKMCDAVITMPGWERAPGARAEVSIARGLGKRVLSSANEYRRLVGVAEVEVLDSYTVTEQDDAIHLSTMNELDADAKALAANSAAMGGCLV